MGKTKDPVKLAKERLERDDEDLVRLYLTDIGQYPLLTKDDEVEDWHVGERLVERLVSRPHDVAAVYEFLQRLEAVVVGAGATSGLVPVPGPVPGE